MDLWLINGEPDGELSPDDRGLNYGDGLFETIALRGGACRFIDDHLQRLANGCQRLHMPEPDMAIIRREIDQLIAGQRDGVVKVVMTRGAGERGYAPPTDCKVTRLVGFAAAEPTACPVNGVQLTWCKTPVSLNPLLAGLKTLNRLDSVLARAELTNKKYSEGLMLDVAGRVVCGTMSNLFVWKDGMLLTPGLSEAGVNGIMRTKILSIARGAGIQTEVRNIYPDDLDEAEGLFVTNALIGLWPVKALDDRLYDPAAGCIPQLMQQLAQLGVRECAS